MLQEKLFDLQLFAEEVDGVQPEVDTPQDEEVEFDFAIDSDGNVVFKDDGEEAPTEEQPPQPSTYKVKVDGQEIEVPLEELLSGYQRQQD